MMRISYLLESTELSGGVKVVALQAEELARQALQQQVEGARASRSATLYPNSTNSPLVHNCPRGSA